VIYSNKQVKFIDTFTKFGTFFENLEAWWSWTATLTCPKPQSPQVILQPATNSKLLAVAAHGSVVNEQEVRVAIREGSINLNFT
jgi:hypothetical protein